MNWEQCWKAACVVALIALFLSACAVDQTGQRTEPGGTDLPAGSPLQASLEAPAELHQGEEVELRFTLTNNSDSALYVLKWYTPLEGIAGEIFTVERDGQALPYQGILASRVTPTRDDYVLLEPGESVSAEVDLGTAYDFSQTGLYTIAFLSPRISHVASSEAELAESLDDLGPVPIPSNQVTITVISR
jgi:hypothetical protein